MLDRLSGDPIFAAIESGCFLSALFPQEPKFMRPEFSVVVPAYNAEEFLEETLHSLVNQSLPASEIIVVNDGSTDKTEAIAKAFPSPVRIINQENQGLGLARAKGIANARHEWIALCDSDDIW